MTPLVIGVTSHRDIPADEIEPIRKRVCALFSMLQREFPGLPLVVVSALAEGGDQLVAREALAAGARLVAPLPLPRDLYTDDFTDPATRAAFEVLCEQAQLVHMPVLPGNSPHGIGQPGAERDRQYAQVGVFVARQCHILLAIWDGRASQRLGGTAQVVHYYLSGVMSGLIDRRRDAYRHLPGTGDERLVCHVVCSRSGDGGSAPVAPLRPLQVLWRTLDETDADLATMPSAFHTTFDHMAAFNADCATYREDIDAGRAERSGFCEKPGDREHAAEGLFCAADWLAIHFQRRVLLAMRTTYTLAAMMGIAFMCYADLPKQDYMIFVFLLLFAVGVALNAVATRRGWHRKYLDYRALAEGLRVQAYWRRAGISITSDPEFARDNFMQKQDIEMGWIRNVMRATDLESATGENADDPQDLGAVIRAWVGTNDGGGQLGYYRKMAMRRVQQHHFTEALGAGSLWAGIGISVLLAVLVQYLTQDAKTALVAVMAVLSILAAVREAYAYKKADKELIKQYRFMQRIFANARAALDRTGNATEQREILRALGEAALAEHVEWALMHRQRPLERSTF